MKKPLSTNLGPVHTYPDVIENGDFLFYFHAFYTIRDSNFFTLRRVYITVENFTNLSRVYIRLCKYRKNLLYSFYKLTFPKKKKKNSLALIKEKFLPVANNYAFQNMDFSRLKCQLKRKACFVEIFQVSADEVNG